MLSSNIMTREVNRGFDRRSLQSNVNSGSCLECYSCFLLTFLLDSLLFLNQWDLMVTFLFQKFQKVCYVIEEKSQLLLSINNFLDETVVLPPGDWDRENQIGIKEILKLKEKKRQRLEAMEKLKREKDEEERMKLVCEAEAESEKEDVDKRLGFIQSNFQIVWLE